MTLGGKRRTLGRVAMGLALMAAVWLCGVWPPPVWWRTHWPNQTAMMRLRGTAVGYRPTALSEMPPVLRRMVMIGEDSRFPTHHGFDFEEIRDALGLDRQAGFGRTVRTIWTRRDRLRGASTITQQLAKNLYLSPSRNPLRKLKEAVTAVRLEIALSKDRILELYLNLVELGPDVWGMPAASQHYFAVPVAQVSEDEAAALAATLPFPRASNPAYRSGRMLHRRDLILARYRGVDVDIPPEEEPFDSVPVPEFTPPVIPPVIDTLLRDSISAPVDSTSRDSAPDTAGDSTAGDAGRSVRPD